MASGRGSFSNNAIDLRIVAIALSLALILSAPYAAHRTNFQKCHLKPLLEPMAIRLYFSWVGGYSVRDVTPERSSADRASKPIPDDWLIGISLALGNVPECSVLFLLEEANMPWTKGSSLFNEQHKWKYRSPSAHTKLSMFQQRKFSLTSGPFPFQLTGRYAGYDKRQFFNVDVAFKHDFRVSYGFNPRYKWMKHKRAGSGSGHKTIDPLEQSR